MTLAQDIYESLLTDPELDTGPNQTREEFAKQEAEQRAKQHYNNIEALSLANEPLKETSSSPIKNLIQFVENTSTTILNSVKYKPETIEDKEEAQEVKETALEEKSKVEEVTPKIEDKPNKVSTPKNEDELTKASTPENIEARKRQDRVTALKEVMDEGNHEYLDDPDAYNDKEIDNLWNKHVRDSSAKTKQQIADDNQKEAEKKSAIEEKAKVKEEADKVKAQVLSDKEEQAQVSQAAKEEAIKQKEAQKQEKQNQKEANVLPHKAGDLEKLAGVDEDGNMNELPHDIATLHAMELAAHQKQYKNYMNPKTQAALKDALIDAQDKGADIYGVMNEIEEMGDSFGSPDHMKDLHEKTVKGVEFHQNHKELVSGNTPKSQKVLGDAIKHGSHSTFTEMDEDGKPTTYKDHPDYEKHKDANKNHQDIVAKISKDYNATYIDPADIKEDLDKIAKGHSDKITSTEETLMSHYEEHKKHHEYKQEAEAKLEEFAAAAAAGKTSAGLTEDDDKASSEMGGQTAEGLQMSLNQANDEIKDLEENKIPELEKERQKHADSLTNVAKDRDALGKAEQGVKDFNSFKEAHHDEESKKEPSKQHHLLHTLDPIQQKHADALKQAQKSGDKEAFQKSADALKESGVPEEDILHMAADGTKKDEPTGDGPPDPDVARKKMAEGYVWHKETRHWIKKETLQEMQGGHGGFDASIVSADHGGEEGGGGAFAVDEHGNSSDKNFLFHGSGNLMAIGDGKHPSGGSISANGIAGNALHGTLKDGGHLDEHAGSGKGVTKIKNFSHPDIGSGGNSGIHHLNSPDAKVSGLKEKFQTGQAAGKAAGDEFKANIESTKQEIKDGISNAATGFLDAFTPSFLKGEEESALSLLLAEYNPEDKLKYKKQTEELLEYIEENKDSDGKPVEKSIISI